MASRSTVRRAPARSSALDSADGASSSVGRSAAVMDLVEIAELGELLLEIELHHAGGAVALLGDDDLGLVVRLLEPRLPFGVFGIVGARLLGAEIVFVAVDEHDDVGVLLDRARFPEVGELRALVLAALDLTRELRERHQRNVELLGELLQRARDLRELLHAVLVACARRGAQELEI